MKKKVRGGGFAEGILGIAGNSFRTEQGFLADFVSPSGQSCSVRGVNWRMFRKVGTHTERTERVSLLTQRGQRCFRPKEIPPESLSRFGSVWVLSPARVPLPFIRHPPRRPSSPPRGASLLQPCIAHGVLVVVSCSHRQTSFATACLAQDCSGDDYRGTITLAKETGDAAALQEAKADVRKRQISWVVRDKEGTWKVRKRQRVASHEWLLAVENQLRTCTANASFKFFQQDEDPAQRPNPLLWPRLMICGDQASCQLCPVSYLTRKLRVNCEFVNDPNHGAWNDVQAALSTAHLTAHQKMMMVAENVAHGPWSEDVRWVQIQRAIREHFDAFGPESSELFKEFALDMLQELGETARASSDGADRWMWNQLKASEVWAKKGAKVNWNRFLGAIKKAKETSRIWHQKTWGLVITCLELGFLQGAGIQKLRLNVRLPDDEREPMRRPGYEDQALKNACCNQLSLACMMFCDRENQMRQRMIICSSNFTMKWFSNQATQLRDVESNKAWLEDQINGGFFAHLNDTLMCLTNPNVIRCAGLFPIARSLICECFSLRVQHARLISFENSLHLLCGGAPTQHAC